MLISPFRLATAALTLLSSSAAAQAVRLVTPNATLNEEFSQIRGVRELADGRLLVSDYIDQRVVLVDFDKGTVLVRVGKGSGPREARLPTRLVPAIGDSTFLVDLGNNRLLVLDGQGRPVRTISESRIGVLGVRGMGPDGAFYFAIPGWAERENALPGDSVRIVKWNPRTDAQATIAVIQGDRMRSDIREPALTPRIPTVGYASQDAWLMSGSVLRIVRAGGYRIESRPAAGAPVVGPSYAYQTRTVSAADRVAYVRRFNESSPMSGKGENGGMGYSPAMSDAELAQTVKGTQYAERHPMFDAGAVIAGPGGSLWVGRPPEEGKPVLYDLFDDAGKRVRAVELLPGRRVAAVGSRSVYVVVESEAGIQRLERYPLPK